MNLKLQIIICAVVISFFVYVANLLRKKKIDFKYALGWIALSFIVLILTVFPDLLGYLSVVMGIATPVNMLFFFGFCLSLVMIFSLSISLSHANDRVKKLAQELAILKRTVYDDEMRIVYEEQEK